MKQRGAANILIMILGIFIIVILFGYFKNSKGIFKKPQDPEKIYSGCGIDIYSPKIFSKVDNIFEFSGKANGCGWNPQNGFIGNLQVLDANNNLLTDNVNIPVGADGVFNIKIGLKRSPVSDAGLINFQSINQAQIASFSIYFK